MAELGIAAGVAGVVGFGAKLSVALYGFANTMASARREIFSVAQEVAQSSAALKQVSKTISNPRTARNSTCALGAILDITISCQERFTELNSIVDRLQAERPKNGEVSVSFVAKVKWAFGRRSKAHDLREELNATKLTLLLMLSTLNLSNEMMSRRNSVASLVDRTTGADVEEEQQVVDSLVIAQQMSIENLRERESEREIEEQSCDGEIRSEHMARVSIPVHAQNLDATMPPRALQKRLSRLLVEVVSEFTSTQPISSETTSCPSPKEQALLTKNARVFRVFNVKHQPNGLDEPLHRIDVPSLESLEHKRTGKLFSQAVLDSTTKPVGTTLAIKAASSPATQQQTSSEHEQRILSLHSTLKNKEALGAVRTEMNQAPMTDTAVPKNVKLFSIPHATKANERQDLYLSTPAETQSQSTKPPGIVSRNLYRQIERERLRVAAAKVQKQPPVVAITASKRQDIQLITSTVTQSLGTNPPGIVPPTEIMRQRIERRRIEEERLRVAAENEQRQDPVVAITVSKAADFRLVQSQTVTRSRSDFPHAFERWEDLSARWEGLTGYWLRKIEQVTEETREQPLTAQLKRVNTDLSSAGHNLFHALVEMQRLKASSECKFQRWFFEMKQTEERSQETSAQLEQALSAERQARADDHKSWEAKGKQAKRSENNAAKLVVELRRELEITKEESRRAWEELARREKGTAQLYTDIEARLALKIRPYTITGYGVTLDILRSC